MTQFFSLISDVVNPIVKIIDNLHTSEEEKLKIRENIFTMQVEVYQKAMHYETELMKMKSNIIQEEARNSWLQKNWRPMTMIYFLFLLSLYWFGYAPDYLIQNPTIMEKMLSLLQMGIGGYIAGRTIEKVVPNIPTHKDLNKKE